MEPVELAPLRFTVKGTVPPKTSAVMLAWGGAEVGLVKVNGEEWGLSVPLLKAAVSVKLVVSAGRDTVQSMEVALGLCVWHASAPSI